MSEAQLYLALHDMCVTTDSCNTHIICDNGDSFFSQY